MQPRLPSKYLVPLLKGAKDAPTGEFEASDAGWWILDAPERRPAQGPLAEYIKLGERLGVSDSPSVSSRGDSWWHVNWRKAQVAVSIHPAFQHQVWWSDEPFVTTNNMHVLSFADKVGPSDRELVAACLASAFGSLSALYRSSEVGCEGVRWVSTGDLEHWCVLDTTRVEQDDKLLILEAYREYRKLKTTKLYEMAESSREAWIRLTEAVARAARMADPVGAAEAAVRTAIETTRRRRQREVRATGGRTRAGAKGQARLARTVKTATAEHPRALARDVVEDTLARFIERQPDGTPPAGYEAVLDSLRNVIIKTIQADVARSLR